MGSFNYSNESQVGFCKYYKCSFLGSWSNSTYRRYYCNIKRNVKNVFIFRVGLTENEKDDWGQISSGLTKCSKCQSLRWRRTWCLPACPTGVASGESDSFTNQINGVVVWDGNQISDQPDHQADVGYIAWLIYIYIIMGRVWVKWIFHSLKMDEMTFFF